jgi:ubiquinone/menaquinone biosynthesis C-methylase UbiE
MQYQPDELFRSTAEYYARYRAGYPVQLFTHLSERFHLNGTQRVLDLGCGAGQIAIPIASAVHEVIAVDPEPAMLAEGRRLAAKQNVTNIDWQRGDSCQLADMAINNINLITMGASFHWMDRPVVLDVLDRLVQPDGAVIVASNSAANATNKPPWDEIVTTIRTRWLGTERRAGSRTYTHPSQRHEEILSASPFSHVEIVNWTWTLERDLDSVVGLQFSYSYSAPALLGENARAFEADLRRELAAVHPSDTWTELIQTEAIIATRP